MRKITRVRGGEKGAPRTKRSKPSVEVEDEGRVRPTASARVRKTEKVSKIISNATDLPFQPPFVEPNNGDEQEMESFERALQEKGKNILEKNLSPTREGISEPKYSRCSRRVKGLVSCSERIPQLNDYEVEDYEDEGDHDVEVIGDEDYTQEEEGDEELDDSQLGGPRQIKEVLGQKYDILKQPLEGGPRNLELLKSFRGHVAYYIWHGQERKVLKGHKQTSRLSKWVLTKMEVKCLISRSGLAHLTTCMHSKINMPLICAFIERWQPETNSFHLPFGEMTITLHDVGYILGIPISGIALSNKILLAELKEMVSAVLNFSEDEVNKEYQKGVIKLNTIQECCSNESITDENLARGYLLWLLGCTLFVDRSGNCVSPHYLYFLMDLEKIKDYSWGSACLAFLYHQLGKASRFDNAQVGGCLTLLQVWIFEYFPIFRPAMNECWDITLPYALRWFPGCSKRNDASALVSYRRLLDNMKVDEVSWTPFDKNPHLQYPITLYTGIIHCKTIREPYMPDRILRQFGYVQIIPSIVLYPKKCYRGPESNKYMCTYDDNVWTWETWRNHCVRIGELGCYRANFFTEAVEGYSEYYLARTHPRVNNDKTTANSLNEPSQMTETARLQYLGARLYYLHPDVRHLTDKTTFFQCIDEVTQHMEDWMPKLQDFRRKGL